jgi:nucleotide-binding universal stress UspA family protein
MGLKDILVHVDCSKANAARVRAAIELAQRHGAHVTGLYVIPWVNMPAYAEFQVGPEVIQAQEEAARSQASDAEAAFRAALEETDLASEWRCVEGDIVSTINVHGRYSDLIVLGQPGDQDPMAFSDGIVDDVVITSGRPVLVVPYIGMTRSIGEHVMVAWNARREAVRAIHDALPILRQAREVKVLAINAHSGDADHGDIPCADICLHLARHGVAAVAQELRADDIEVGDILLSRAADAVVDLLVMGAYGHSRLREFILGGATRHLLSHMTVPVLMSH